jgi:serine/threonine protein kinase
MSEDADTPLSRFLVAFRTDVEAKSVRPLSEYLARFTGDDVGIAREYVAEVGGPASEGRDPRARVGPADRTRVGPYRTIKEIGRGGQGAVFLAEDTRLRRTVALKVLNDVGTLSASALERFRREAAVASRLDHPGICPVYDVGLDGRTPFIAMKLVEGSTLAAIVGSRRDETLADEAAYFEVTTTGSAAAPDRAKPGAAPNVSWRSSNKSRARFMSRTNTASSIATSNRATS